MRVALKLHPDSACDAVTTLEVDISRHPTEPTLALQYWLGGKLDNIRWPSRCEATRSDELWRHTCFEAFVRVPPDAGYFEFNLSPSTQWAAYRFADYREGMSLPEIPPPVFTTSKEQTAFRVAAAIDLGKLRALVTDALWQIGLSAVIEETNGNISYWALAHPSGKPDFHNLACFGLNLLPRGGAVVLRD